VKGRQGQLNLLNLRYFHGGALCCIMPRVPASKGLLNLVVRT